MRLENIETPALVLDMDAAEHNMELMSDYMKDTGLSLRPHYKSSKCTYIAHMQIKAGAKGITCAKVSEAEDLILSGVEDVLIANEVIEPSKIARIAYLCGQGREYPAAAGCCAGPGNNDSCTG